MKIQVNFSIKSNSDVNSIIDLVASPSETVASLKDKVAGAQLIPFPEQVLSFDGKVLEDGAKLSSCGVGEGCILKFEVKASEATLTQQLSELLQARDVSGDELGLLYCYKYGANIKQALKLLGFQGKFEDFINSQKSLSMNNGSVAIVREDTKLKPFSVADEVVHMLKGAPSGVIEIRDLCQQFVRKFGVSLSSLVASRPVDFLSANPLFVVHGQKKDRVSLHGVRKKGDTPPSPPPGVAIECPPGLAAALASRDTADASPGLGPTQVAPHKENIPPGLANVSTEPDDCDSVDAQQYLDLHNAICSRPFNSKVMQTVNDLVATLSESSFLDIDHVVTAGSIGKGTAISGSANAQVVLFLQGLPESHHEAWMPSLLRAVAGALVDQLQGLGVDGVHVVDECIKMSMKSFGMTVELFLSPVFGSYSETLKVLCEQQPDARKFYTPALAKERTQFISRQPSSVRTSIRLMKWWRDQQHWSTERAYPSDELLELTTIYSAVQTKPADQKTAIANVMSLLARFDKLRVVWSNYYSKDDVWEPLLCQRPLLMDPTNPFLNVADPRIFDASDLMELAKTTHFFW